jgi:hypothetical protein
MKSKKKSVLRQAIRTSVKELRELADDWEKGLRVQAKDVHLPYSEKQKILVFIVNKEPKYLDTWRFEK